MAKLGYLENVARAIASGNQAELERAHDRLQLRTLMSENFRRSPSSDGLSNIVTDESGVKAQSQLFLSGWTKKLIHGADMAMLMMSLATHLLKPGEKVKTIAELQFRRLVQTELQLHATFDRTSKKEASVIGRFITSTGRTIYVDGIPIARPITGGSWTNRPEVIGALFTTDTIESEMVTAEGLKSYGFRIIADREKLGTEMMSRGNQVATTLDLANSGVGFLSSPREIIKNTDIAAGCRDLVIPDLNALARRGRIFFTPKGEKPLRNGWHLVDVDVNFYSDRTKLGGGTMTYAYTPSIGAKLIHAAEMLDSEWLVDPGK